MSIQSAVSRLGYKIETTNDPNTAETADKIILPGVCSATQAMKNLKERRMVDFLKETEKPVLGICLGMQLLFDFSEEGETEGLGILPGTVKRISGQNFSIPHMGWNSLEKLNLSCPLLNGIEEGDFFYYAHSYYVPSHFSMAKTSYGGFSFNALLQYNNFFGCQFHLERSGKRGEKMLENFLEL